MTNLCPDCFGERGLKNRLVSIRPKYPDEKCDFHPTKKGIPLSDVASIIDDVFRSNFAIGDYVGRYYGQEGDPLSYVIGDITAAETDDIAELITEHLIEEEVYDPRDGDEPFYASDQNYIRYDSTSEPHSYAWQAFKSEVMHGHRFFASSAHEELLGIFKSIHLQKDKEGLPVVYQIDPSDTPIVYRARRLDEPEKRKEAVKEPWKHLSPPPRRLRKAGRMNAAGVPAFYGAFDLETCVAELRPPVGSIIVCCEFNVIRPLVVLDTTRFEAPALQRSLFSKFHDERLMQWRFMQKFAYEISKPVLPDDEELDYIPTQAVAEFINTQLPVFVHGQERRVDGIIFSSAQRPGGKNIVWLGDAAQVMGAAQPEPTDLPERDLILDVGLKKTPSPALRAKPGAVHVRLIEGAKFLHSEIGTATSLMDDLDL